MGWLVLTMSTIAAVGVISRWVIPKGKRGQTELELLRSIDDRLRRMT